MMLLRFTLLLLGMFWRAGTETVLDCDKCELGVLTACKPTRTTCSSNEQCFIGIGVKNESAGPVSYMEKGCLPVAECNKVVDGAAEGALANTPEMKICCASDTDCAKLTLDTFWNSDY